MTHENKIKYLYPFSAPMSIEAYLKRINSRIVFPFWHVVSDAELPHISCLYKVQTSNEFKTSLEVLLQHFVPISVEDVLSQENLNPNKNYMCLSFDDGLVQMHDIVAPILKSRGIPAAFFINPPFVGDAQYFFRYERSALLYHLLESQNLSKSKQNEILDSDNSENPGAIWENYGVNRKEIMEKQRIYMNCDEVKSLHNSGFHIGAHSMTHANFACISADEKNQEVKQSVDWVSENIQTKIRSFAFPFSDDGLSQSEIKQIYKTADLTISFGTSGHGKMKELSHYQRIPMEHTRVYPTQKILKSELFAAWLKQKLKSQ